MSKKIAEEAHETIHEHGGGHSDAFGRRVAVLVSALAAGLAITEIAVKSTANEYLTHHIAVSDDYAYYQSRNVRSLIKESEAAMLSALGAKDDPSIAAAIKESKDYSQRMRDDPKTGDGMKQLLERVHVREEERNEALHHYHIYEYCSGALELSIVLASVSVVTRIPLLAYTAFALGALGAVVALAVAGGLT